MEPKARSCLVTMNKQVACTPPKNQAVTTRVQAGFASFEQKQSLEELEVVFDAANIEGDPPANIYFTAGRKVYIKGEDINTLWAKKVLEMYGKRFILVPLSSIVAVGNQDASS